MVRSRRQFALLDAAPEPHLEGRREPAQHIYLVVVLNWAPFAGVDLARWPVVQAYHRRLGQRAAVARAMKEELALYLEEQRLRAA